MPTSHKSASKQRERRKKISAYFLKLEIENILCFKDQQCLNLSDKNGHPAQWTVILGDNGTGKTTLLRCIAGMSIYEDRSSVAAPWIFTFNADPFEPNAINTIKHSNGIVKVYGIGGVQIKDNNKKGKEFSLRFHADNQYDYSSYFDIPDDANLLGLICYGYGASRQPKQSSLTDNQKLDNCSSLFFDSSSLINAEEWLLQADYIKKSTDGLQKEKIETKLSAIKNVFKKVLLDVEDFDFFFDDTLLYDRLTVKFKTPDGWVHFSDLGLGYKTMIVWILDLIIRLYERYPDSGDPLSEPAIVLVDEIDLHLHPKWQRQIMSFLTERFPNTQFIVTAHSPLVVQASQDANIVLLRRDGDRVVIDNNPEIIDNWRVDQILTSLFELPSARPATLDPYIEEREQILSKTHLTEVDKTRLDELREKIGSLPTGERPEDRKAMDIIRRAAKLIEEQNQQ